MEDQDRNTLREKIVGWIPREEKDEMAPAGPRLDGQASESGGMDRMVKRRRWTPKRIAGLVLGGLFVAAVGYEFLLGDHRSKLNVQVNRITVSTVERGPFQEFIPVRGTVLPIQTVYLDALEGGRVEQVFVEEGSMVKKNEPILKLSNSDLELSVMGQEASLFEQLNNLENTRITLQQQAITRREDLIDIEHNLQEAKRTFEKDQQMMDRNLIARNQYEEDRDAFQYLQKKQAFTLEAVREDSLYRRSRLSQLEASAERLERNLEAIKQNLSHLVVRAPVTGQLSALNAEIGQLKSRGVSLGQVDVLDGYKVRVQIDEFYIARVKVGQTGTFEYGGKTCNLVIRKVYPEVRDGQFEVDMGFTGKAPEEIRRGQTLQIRLALGDLSDALLLPRGGFYQTTGGNWVFVVDPSGAFALRRPIRIGRQNPEYFEVLDGLKPGEKVVTSSYENYEGIDELVLKR